MGAVVPVGLKNLTSGTRWNALNEAGIVADGVTDCTAGVQAAINKLAAQGFGVLVFPAGNYFFSGVLTLPSNVHLEGSWPSMVSYANWNVYHSMPSPTQGGTTFLVTNTSIDFLSIYANTSVRGIRFYYPTTLPNATPTAFPWTVHGYEFDWTVENCEFVNVWKGIAAMGTSAQPTGRFLIRNVHGQCFNTGIAVDAQTDTSHIQNVHWHDEFSNADATDGSQVAGQYGLAHATAFDIFRCDDLNISDSMAFRLLCGIHLENSSLMSGRAWVTVSNLLIDFSATAVIIDAAQVPGAKFSNCQFDSPVSITSTMAGAVMFTGCKLYSSAGTYLTMAGSGKSILTGCSFHQTYSSGAATEGTTAGTGINHTGGGLSVVGCQFHDQHSSAHLVVGASVTRSLFACNSGPGTLAITNNAGAKHLAANNLFV